MMKRSIKRKLVKARVMLNQTIQRILDINHYRKHLDYIENSHHLERNMDEELRVLNKIAAQQARLIQHYESTLGTRRKDVPDLFQ